MAISGLSTDQIIRFKDLTLGNPYSYNYDSKRIIPDNILLSSQMLTLSTTGDVRAYTFIGPSTPSPHTYQCVAENMFGIITGWTVNLNVTMYGNVYLRGLSGTNQSAASGATYIYLLPGGMPSSLISTYISAYQTNTNYDLFAISGSNINVGSTTLINYSELNQSFSNDNNKFRQKYLSNTEPTEDVVVNSGSLGWFLIDGFKIGTIPTNEPCIFSFNFTGTTLGVSLDTSVYLVQYKATTTNQANAYGNPGISYTNLAYSYPVPTSLQATFEIPMDVLNYGITNTINSSRAIVTKDERSVSPSKHLTRTVDMTIISPRFTLNNY